MVRILEVSGLGREGRACTSSPLSGKETISRGDGILQPHNKEEMLAHLEDYQEYYRLFFWLFPYSNECVATKESLTGVDYFPRVSTSDHLAEMSHHRQTNCRPCFPFLKTQVKNLFASWRVRRFSERNTDKAKAVFRRRYPD